MSCETRHNTYQHITPENPVYSCRSKCCQSHASKNTARMTKLLTKYILKY